MVRDAWFACMNVQLRVAQRPQWTSDAAHATMPFKAPKTPRRWWFKWVGGWVEAHMAPCLRRKDLTSPFSQSSRARSGASPSCPRDTNPIMPAMLAWPPSR